MNEKAGNGSSQAKYLIVKFHLALCRPSTRMSLSPRSTLPPSPVTWVSSPPTFPPLSSSALESLRFSRLLAPRSSLVNRPNSTRRHCVLISWNRKQHSSWTLMDFRVKNAKRIHDQLLWSIEIFDIDGLHTGTWTRTFVSIGR